MGKRRILVYSSHMRSQLEASCWPSAAWSGLPAGGVRTTTSRWVRKWGGAFDDASGENELGGGESAAGYAPRAEEARRREGRALDGMRRNNSSMSNMSISSGSSAELVVPRHAGMTGQLHMHYNGRMARSHGLALKSASDLLNEVFPEGVPSQGVLKAGVECIEADIRFQMLGNGSPLPAWHGFIVDGVLFVYVSEFSGTEHDFRSTVMALMELAEDVLACSSVIVALPRALQISSGNTPPTASGGLSLDTAAAASLVRAFMYSGFELVSPMLYCPSPAYILVGYDAM